MTLINFTTPLFVPGNRSERFDKAARSGTDAIIIDLEDAVPANAKDEARANLRARSTDIPVLVRMNGERTAWHAADLAAVFKLPFSAVIVPRSELGGKLPEIAADSSTPIWALVESARGVAQSGEIATYSAAIWMRRLRQSG